MVPRHVDLRIPAGHPDPPLARLRELGAHRSRRCAPRDVRHRRRPDRGRSVGADDPAPRRRLPPRDHGGDGPRDAALHRDGRRRTLERRRPDRGHRRHREHQRHRSRHRVGCRRQRLRHLLRTDPERAGDRHASRHPAGEGRSREPHRPGGAALALVGHRGAVPRGPAPLRGRRHLVPDDRRGRHRAGPRNQHRPQHPPRRTVRDGAAEPAGLRPLDHPSRAEHRARRPRHRSGRRVVLLHARGAPAQHDPGVLGARPRDLRQPGALARERLADDRPCAAQPAPRHPGRGRLLARRGARRRVARDPSPGRRRRRPRRPDPGGSRCTAMGRRSTTRIRSSSVDARSI